MEDNEVAPKDDRGSPLLSFGEVSEKDGRAAGDLSLSETRLVMKLSLVGIKDLGASWVAGRGVERVSVEAVMVASGGSRVAVVVRVGWSTGPTSDSESVQLNTEPWEASVRRPPKSL